MHDETFPPSLLFHVGLVHNFIVDSDILREVKDPTALALLALKLQARWMENG